LAIDGLNYHWGRNKNHFIAKNVSLNKELFEFYMSPKITTENAMKSVGLVYNTNNYELRSNNPGDVTSFKSGVAPR
jgi:hypothetical protein